MKIAIHQPNFLPWYPYFHKIKECDQFVILNHCQYEKNNFQNRFNIGDKWYTCRVDKSSGSKATIYEKQYVDFVSDWIKIKDSLPKKYADVLDQIDEGNANQFKDHDNRIADINSHIIISCCILLGIPTHKLAVDIETNKTATDRLIKLTKTFGGTEYLSGPSGPKYMDMSAWKEAEIDVSVVSECGIKTSFVEYYHEYRTHSIIS